MHRPEAPTPDSGRRGIVLLLILCAALGCTEQERTASFPLRQEIPLGALAVSVDGWEEVGAAHAPLSSLRTPEGEKAIAVFVGWSGLEPFAEPDRQTFAEKFLRGRLRLVDSDGFDYSTVAAMPREHYDFTSHASSMPRDWVVVFHVWVDSHGYTLRLSHPDSSKESFDVAIIQLG